MSVRHAVHATVSGPVEAIGDVLAALGRAGLAAHPTKSPWRDDPAECALGWVEVESHEGTDGPPSGEFQQLFEQRVTETVEPFGYRHRLGGVVIGGTTDTREIVRRKTGEVLFRTNAGSIESMGPMLAQMGLDPNELELREPADLWRIPEV
jgi:hypothetical protein